jgi:hypothetical protein
MITRLVEVRVDGPNPTNERRQADRFAHVARCADLLGDSPSILGRRHDDDRNLHLPSRQFLPVHERQVHVEHHKLRRRSAFNASQGIQAVPGCLDVDPLIPEEVGHQGPKAWLVLDN